MVGENVTAIRLLLLEMLTPPGEMVSAPFIARPADMEKPPMVSRLLANVRFPLVVIALLPLPSSTRLAVKDVAPVPPLPTGSVPVIPETRSTSIVEKMSPTVRSKMVFPSVNRSFELVVIDGICAAAPIAHSSMDRISLLRMAAN